MYVLFVQLFFYWQVCVSGMIRYCYRMINSTDGAQMMNCHESKTISEQKLDVIGNIFKIGFWCDLFVRCATLYSDFISLGITNIFYSNVMHNRLLAYSSTKPKNGKCFYVFPIAVDIFFYIEFDTCVHLKGFCLRFYL